MLFMKSIKIIGGSKKNFATLSALPMYRDNHISVTPYNFVLSCQWLLCPYVCMLCLYFLLKDK